MRNTVRAAWVVLLLALAPSCTEDAPAGGSPDAGAGGARQCQGLEHAEHTCACVGDNECFVVSNDYSVCATRNALEPTSCTDDHSSIIRDECGCNGTACPAGLACRQIEETVSGGSYHQNRCFAVCESDADCVPGQACLPNRFDVTTCVAPECRSDADCTEDACGHCERERWTGFQGALWGNVPRCLYEGKSSASSCGGLGYVVTRPPFPANQYLDAHICHEWGADD